jgi:hypothetical protein
MCACTNSTHADDAKPHAHTDRVSDGVPDPIADAERLAHADTDLVDLADAG